MNYDVIIIGGGLGGIAAAQELTHNGKSVAIIEAAPLSNDAIW